MTEYLPNGQPVPKKPKKPVKPYDPLWWTNGKPATPVNDSWTQLPGYDTGKPGLPKPKPKPGDPPGGGGGGYGGGGGGGGGGGAGEGLSQYIQAYRLNFFKNGKPPADILQQAKDNNWSIAYFMQRIRLEDKNYWRSDEAKLLMPEFSRTMKVLFPGLSDKNRTGQLMKSKFYKNVAMWYLKNGVGLKGSAGMELLYSRITNTGRWNKANPYWKDYARNRNIGVAAESNPLLYKQVMDTMKESFAQVGLNELPEDYYRTFARSRYASQDGLKSLGENLKQYSITAGSQEWFQGRPLAKTDVKTATLESGKKGIDLRSRMTQHFGVRSSFLGSEEKPLGNSNLSERGKLVNPLV